MSNPASKVVSINTAGRERGPGMRIINDCPGVGRLHGGFVNFCRYNAPSADWGASPRRQSRFRRDCHAFSRSWSTRRACAPSARRSR